MKRGVLPELRQAALKKLFADPHFNVMDGLDIYIDDYTRPDPIAASVIDQLVQFRNLEAGGAEPPTIEGQPIAALGETECASAADSAVESPVDSMGQPDEAASRDGVAVANLADTKSRQARPIDQTVAADVLQVSVKERKPE
jgi:hypothetical protein